MALKGFLLGLQEYGLFIFMGLAVASGKLANFQEHHRPYGTNMRVL